MGDGLRFSAALSLALVAAFVPLAAHAQQPAGAPQAASSQVVSPPSAPVMQEMPWAPGAGGYYYPPQVYPYPALPPAPAAVAVEDAMTAAQLNTLLNDPTSAQSKAHALARRAQKDNAINTFARARTPGDRPDAADAPPPPGLGTLQAVHQSYGTGYNVTDAAIEEELLDLDIRRDAQREAALSYGARGGLARRQYQVMERLRDFEGTLDRVFDFRALLVQAPSGLLIEPPIVRESLDNIFISSDGSEAAVAAQILDINRQARIVAAPRDWRHYLLPAYESEITPPPRVLWPKDDKEQAEWNGWVKQGWEAGYAQGEETFETNLNQLVADYNGMVRYRMLLAQGKISSPFALHEDRGVTGGGQMMRVGDRALRITGPSQLLTGSEQWTPPDR